MGCQSDSAGMSCKQLGHAALRLCIRLDSLTDFFAVAFIVCPGGSQVGGAQVRMMCQNPFINQAKFLPFHQPVDRVSRIADTRITPADIGMLLNPTCFHRHRSTSGRSALRDAISLMRSKLCTLWM